MSENRTFLEIIAPDVDEAVAQALFELGVEQDEVDVEVLDSGDAQEGRQARVRVSIRLVEPQPDDPTLLAARKTLQTLLEKMLVRARINASWGEAADPEESRPLILDIQGDDLGMLIGHKGETLAALQYIVRLIVSKQLDQLVNVVVDVEGYKVRREHQLRQLARRLAEQAVQRGRTISLEPMPANERRVIHLALRDHPDVVTESVGNGQLRKVTVIPKNKK
ncbi:MAG: KH domain-containing protein [Chloroflexi bacterium]|nr:KH domain-containing protein [Chloroflexota bacterium]